VRPENPNFPVFDSGAGFGVPGFETALTQISLDTLLDLPALIQVRAYDNLDDGTRLYSNPLEKIFEGSADTSSDNLIASADISGPKLFETALLTRSGSVIVAGNTAASIVESPTFVQFDAQLQNPTPVFNDTFTNRSFGFFDGKEREYGLVRGNTDDWARVVAFNSENSEVLWERPLFDRPKEQTDRFGPCTGVVTQDDWFICVRRGVALVAFDPDGNRFVQSPDNPAVDEFSRLLDGENGVLVEIPRYQRAFPNANPNIPVFNTVDLFSGAQNRFRLDTIDELANRQILVETMAVDNDHMLIGGRFTDSCTLDGGNCEGVTGLIEGSFLARVLLADGSVASVITGDISDRAGVGVGEVIGRSVYFARDDLYTRYNADTLELEARQTVPGRAVAFSEDTVLSFESVGRPVVVGYRVNVSRVP